LSGTVDQQLCLDATDSRGLLEGGNDVLNQLVLDFGGGIGGVVAGQRSIEVADDTFIALVDKKAITKQPSAFDGSIAGEKSWRPGSAGSSPPNCCNPTPGIQSKARTPPPAAAEGRRKRNAVDPVSPQDHTPVQNPSDGSVSRELLRGKRLRRMATAPGSSDLGQRVASLANRDAKLPRNKLFGLRG